MWKVTGVADVWGVPGPAVSLTPFWLSCSSMLHYRGHPGSPLKDPGFTLMYYRLKSLTVEIQECSRKVPS